MRELQSEPRGAVNLPCAVPRFTCRRRILVFFTPLAPQSPSSIHGIDLTPRSIPPRVALPLRLIPHTDPSSDSGSTRVLAISPTLPAYPSRLRADGVRPLSCGSVPRPGFDRRTPGSCRPRTDTLVSKTLWKPPGWTLFATFLPWHAYLPFSRLNSTNDLHICIDLHRFSSRLRTSTLTPFITHLCLRCATSQIRRRARRCVRTTSYTKSIRCPPAYCYLPFSTSYLASLTYSFFSVLFILARVDLDDMRHSSRRLCPSPQRHILPSHDPFSPHRSLAPSVHPLTFPSFHLLPSTSHLISFPRLSLPPPESTPHPVHRDSRLGSFSCFS